MEKKDGESLDLLHGKPRLLIGWRGSAGLVDLLGIRGMNQDSRISEAQLK